MFLDTRHLAGVGQARTRTRRSVERLVPFGLLASLRRALLHAQYPQGQLDPYILALFPDALLTDLDPAA